MKRTLFSTFLLLAMLCGWAHLIKPQKATADDYIPLLKEMGYEVYSFDLSELGKDSATYQIQPVVKRYAEGGEEAYMDLGLSFTNRNGDVVYNKATVSLSPCQTSPSPEIVAKQMTFNLDFYKLGYPLYFIKAVSPDGKENTLYESRPFKLEEIKIGEFIPLVLYGSAWYDEECNCYRFCGDNEISPDMHEDIVKYIPEFYVIGVIIRK